MAQISKDSFARILEIDDAQVLIRKDATAEGFPAIVASCQPEGFGVCSLQFHYSEGKDDLDAEELRDKAFESIDEDSAESIIAGVLKMIEDKELGATDEEE